MKAEKYVFTWKTVIQMIRGLIWTIFLVHENDAMIQIQTNAPQVRFELYASERRSIICLRLFQRGSGM